MNALKTYFPTSYHLICRWHFIAKARDKQVKHTDAEGKEEFFDHTDTVNFMQIFYRCIDTDDVDEFQCLRDELDTDYPVMRECFEKNWWPWKDLQNAIQISICIMGSSAHQELRASMLVLNVGCNRQGVISSDSSRPVFHTVHCCIIVTYHWERQPID
jgi:hypothetical protein